ncbi:type I-MYXAN CRISPR-associated protein Cmx8 [Thiocapsa roseopersicina]|uniref:CRISPR type MYXAN-associated protein Cmx8 n=1 Tax=Thiocapsa roseopersicina TaxID=1058 RepID=A0A1H2W335_THIRO|nr:type I-MYXAN CRISPR-associated protein Cmx8 [Thiocapsa roseopersicina]SDW74896.1 CRISPR type MYXAN-associated protein Cmx8 [Thiocapsa roseopersicina]
MTAELATKADSLVLDYDLLDLPTAQHKAGLAGLLLHLRSLEQRGIAGAPSVERLDRFGTSVRFSRASLQLLFDDLYAAKREQILSRSKYANKPPLGETFVEVKRGGKVLQEKRYVYEDERPGGRVLAFWLSKGPDDPWLRLWQNMLWGILRAQPTTRGEYKNRADEKPVSFVGKLWLSLKKAQKQRAKGALVTESIAGSLFIGAQDKNAERVSFLGRIEHNLLLHFWQWAAPIFVPRSVDARTGNWEYRGFLVVIPEVADLVEIREDMERYWRRLEPEASGYRPTQALVDLPAEGGLEFLYHLTRDKLERADMLYGVHGVELYHQEKQGNNVRQHIAERMRVDQGLLRAYVNARDRRAHPLFKRLLIGNLVRGEPWFEGAQDLFDRYPIGFFIQRPDSPRTRFFGSDVHKRFEQIIQDLEHTEKLMQPTGDDEALQRLIYKLIRNYVDLRTRDRASIGDKKFSDLSEADKQKYRDVKPKVATGAFLALRGRRDQDIAEYFTGTLCSVGHYLSEDDFLLIGNLLMHNPEKAKNLAMLALSAHSWTPRAKDEQTDSAQAPAN